MTDEPERTVYAFKKDGKIDMQSLTALAQHPEADGFIVLIKWKDGGFTTGWSAMDDGELAFGMKVLNKHVDIEIFGDHDGP